MKKIAVIPIDNRPICYDLIKDILAQDSEVELFLPDIELLGGLSFGANIEGLFEFINKLPEVDYLIISLDTIAYGGLVNSRRCSKSFEEIQTRLEKFKTIVSKKAKKVLAFSSIMRISNNNINEEEKEYWAQYGKRIYEFSYHQHKSRKAKSFNCVYNQIPADILEDYLSTRKRNFEINKLYLNWLEDGVLDYLIFSKDDCAEFGLNVEEGEILEQIIKQKELLAKVKTGADEIPLSLLSRALLSGTELKIKPVFRFKNSIDLISKYEDISIKNCVLSQLELAGCRVDETNFDMQFYINNFEFEQGDNVLGELVNCSKTTVEMPKERYFVADVNNANGADVAFVEDLLGGQYSSNLMGYCAYNTSANSIGCAILSAVVNFISQNNKSNNSYATKKLMFVRFLDDFSYQSKIRKSVAGNNLLNSLDFYDDEIKLAKYLDFKYNSVKYTLPWNRSFEIRVEVE